jgi:integrase
MAGDQGSKPKRRRATKRGQNEGSIYLGDDGRWRSMVPAKFTPDGRRKMIVGSSRKGTNTREWVAGELAKALSGNPVEVVAASKETVATFLARWLEAVEARIRPKTLEAYTYTAKSLIIPHIGSVKLQALEPRHVVTMMNRLRADGRAVRSVAYARTVLRIALTDAKRWGIVSKNVADREHVDPPRLTRGEVDAYSAAEVGKILAKISDSDDRAMIRTIATFGLRVGEVLGLQWKDVDFEARTLRIVRAVQRQQPNKGLVFAELKTGRSRRSLLMPESLVTELKEHRRRQLEQKLRAANVWEDHDLLFPTSRGTPQDSRNVLRILHRAETAAGLPKKGLHKLRSSAATIMLTAGVPLDVVSQMLGHSSIKMTADVYTAFVLRRQEQAAEVMGDLLWKKES